MLRQSGFKKLMEIKGGDQFEKEMTRIGTMLNGGAVKIGFLAGATYPDGKPVAMIAAIHTYGKWPFFQTMVANKSPEWGPAIADLLRENNYNGEHVLELTGHAIAGQLRQQIVDTVTPPNAPATIARKGFDKPLIETSHMLNSVDFEVVR